jgi:tRNA-dihydrouridine synthase
MVADLRKVMKLNRHNSLLPMMDWTDRHCRYFHRLLSAMPCSTPRW